MTSSGRPHRSSFLVSLLFGLLLACQAQQAQSAPCRGSGELEPPLRADEFFHVAFSPASGFERTALFQVPATAPPDDRTMVILLHGGGNSDREDLLSDMRSTGWVEIAEREGIVLAYPTAMQEPGKPNARFNWNDGRLGTDIWSMPDNVDVEDVGYLAEIMDFSQDQLGVGERIFVLGVSNGGMMAYRLAADPRTQGRIRGMVAMVAQIPVDRAGIPVAPVPLLMISGNLDPLTPYQGGDMFVQVELQSGQPLGDPIYSGTVVSFGETLQRFLGAHGCSARPRLRNLPDSDADGIFVRELSFCAQTAVVKAYLVVSGGHRWHGIGDNSEDWVRDCFVVDTGSSSLNTFVFVGSTGLDGFSATRAAWRFLRGL